MVVGLNGFFKILLLLALILELSDCTQASIPSSQGLPPGELIDIKKGTFIPDNITVPLNTTVIWANHDMNPTEVVADNNSFDSGEIYPDGYEYMYIFLQPGVYGYHSKENPSMNGQIIVANANGTLPKVTKPSAPHARANQTVRQTNVTARNATAGNIIATNVTSRVASNATSTNQSKSVFIALTAKNIAFDKKMITVPAGSKVTINFDNQDSGVPHNFALYQSSLVTGAIFKGQIVTGPTKTTYTFAAPSKPGTYYFQCDVHPNQMYGQFIVQ